jgi:hypothetical protein
VPTKAAAKNAEKSGKTEQVMLKQLEIGRVEVAVIGDTSLICHAWSEKVKKEMLLDKKDKPAKGMRAPRNAEESFRGSLYHIGEDRYGFPAIAFKAAAIRAAQFTNGLKMVYVRGAFHIDAELVEIVGKPTMREDMVRLQTGVADVRYRGEFKEWKTVLPIRYNKSAIKLDTLLDLLNTAGFAVGVGEWRPTGKETSGQHGMFHVALQSELS